ncbi:MAG: hypothetical protein KJS95_03765 [Gammaproteobacteria bacterium]|nr:hypothetical protein [Gammaproteobacteria bacterium]
MSFFGARAGPFNQRNRTAIGERIGRRLRGGAQFRFRRLLPLAQHPGGQTDGAERADDQGEEEGGEDADGEPVHDAPLDICSGRGKIDEFVTRATYRADFDPAGALALELAT